MLFNLYSLEKPIYCLCPGIDCLVSQVKTNASGCLNSSANSPIAAILRVLAPQPVRVHLVGPGFEISDRYLKRAGLRLLAVSGTYDSLDTFQTYHQQRGGRWIGFSVAGSCSYIHFQFQPDDWLLFGSETGLPPALSACSNCLHPMTQPGVRSLIFQLVWLWVCLKPSSTQLI